MVGYCALDLAIYRKVLTQHGCPLPSRVTRSLAMTPEPGPRTRTSPPPAKKLNGHSPSELKQNTRTQKSH